MTRILYWNINNFSLNKIANPAHLATAHDRRTHIVDEVMMSLGGGLPDIFVVVEVYARLRDVGTEGVPIVGNARAGVIALLGYIRAQTGNPNWFVVPPVWSGMYGFGEGIAVFYNAMTVQFTGPYVFGPDFRKASMTRAGNWYSRPTERSCPLAETAPAGGTPPLPAGWVQGPQDYSPSWAGTLPARVTPGGVLPDEDQLAGQYDFYTGAFPPARIYFTTLLHRSPFLTHFLDLVGAGAGRTIKLFSMHTSPGFANASVEALATVPEIVAGPNEVTVVAGDFNADTFDSRAAYDGLVGAVGGGGGGLGMTMAFRPETGGAIQPARRPYCLTHMLPRTTATPDGLAGGVAPAPVHDVYPRYGYMGSMGGWHFQNPVNSGAIDNFLTLHGAGAFVPPNNNATIVNTVVGKPYAAIAAPANVTAELTGGLAVASTLAVAIPVGGEDSAAPGALGPMGATTIFRDPPNLGRIRDTSDHLALAIDV